MNTGGIFFGKPTLILYFDLDLLIQHTAVGFGSFA